FQPFQKSAGEYHKFTSSASSLATCSKNHFGSFIILQAICQPIESASDASSDFLKVLLIRQFIQPIQSPIKACGAKHHWRGGSQVGNTLQINPEQVAILFVVGAAEYLYSAAPAVAETVARLSVAEHCGLVAWRLIQPLLVSRPPYLFG